MKILLTGASGFVGRRLIERFSRDGHTLHAIGRRPPPASRSVEFSPWDADGGHVPTNALDGCDAVVHLAGEPVAQRWNGAVKARIRNSRVRGTTALVEAIAARNDRPRVMVSASAIGYYGDRADEILDETSPKGTGFLADVCEEWEREAGAAGNLGV